MASILDLLNTTVGEEFIRRAGRETSENNENAAAIISLALPMLLGGLSKNLRDNSKADDLDKALASEKHGEQRLKKLEQEESSILDTEGGKILNHIFGGEEKMIIDMISRTLGMNESSVEKIIKMSAPMLLSILASQKQKDNLSSTDLVTLISSVLGKSSKYDSSLIETLLIKDHDSSVINNEKGMILGGGNKGKKDGGILGGMLGSK